MEGRYRFTLAHEGGGHWRLHRDHSSPPIATRDAFRGCGQARRVFAVLARPRSGWNGRRITYASCLLMPRRMVHAEWDADRFGRTKPLLLSDLRPNGRVMSRAETLSYRNRARLMAKRWTTRYSRASQTDRAPFRCLARSPCASGSKSSGYCCSSRTTQQSMKGILVILFCGDRKVSTGQDKSGGA